MYICKFCNSIRKNTNSLRNHERLCPKNDKRKYVSYSIGRIAWNKGLTKESDERVKRNSKSASATFQKQIIEGTYIKRRMGLEARQKLSESQSLHNRGGKSKWFDYNGTKLQGTWELQLAQYFDKVGIKWKKLSCNRDILKYIDNDKVKSYTPDFFLEDFNLYLEVKGYWWGKDKEKMKLVQEQNKDVRIVIIEKQAFKKILQGEQVW